MFLSSNRTTLYPAVLAVMFFILLFYLAFIPLLWGYDEYGAAVTALELDDYAYMEIYKSFLLKADISSRLIIWLYEHIFLPIFITPIRWTYSLGISPWLNLIRFVSLEWEIMRIILLLPSLMLSSLGFYWIAKFLYETQKSITPAIIFLTIIVCSYPFLYWTITLTSYSHHLICVGLICQYIISLEYKPYYKPKFIFDEFTLP